MARFLLFAQENRNAYEAGRMVGQITAYVLLAAIALWLIGKLFKKG